MPHRAEQSGLPILLELQLQPYMILAGDVNRPRLDTRKIVGATARALCDLKDIPTTAHHGGVVAIRDVHTAERIREMGSLPVFVVSELPPDVPPESEKAALFPLEIALFRLDGYDFDLQDPTVQGVITPVARVETIDIPASYMERPDMALNPIVLPSRRVLVPQELLH